MVVEGWAYQKAMDFPECSLESAQRTATMWLKRPNKIGTNSGLGETTRPDCRPIHPPATHPTPSSLRPFPSPLLYSLSSRPHTSTLPPNSRKRLARSPTPNRHFHLLAPLLTPLCFPLPHRRRSPVDRQPLLPSGNSTTPSHLISTSTFIHPPLYRLSDISSTVVLTR